MTSWWTPSPYPTGTLGCNIKETTASLAARRIQNTLYTTYCECFILEAEIEESGICFLFSFE